MKFSCKMEGGGGWGGGGVGGYTKSLFNLFSTLEVL